MKNKIICICGPTAVGKTDLAIKLTKLVNGVIVACDSRQVYKGMDIGTGKEKSNLGIDLVDINQPFSVMNYVSLIQPVLKQLLTSGKTPILTAGTGLYLKYLFNPPQTGLSKPNEKLRLQLNPLPIIELQQELERVDPKKWVSMNHSDQNNPRRLIRAIEIAVSSASNHLTIEPYSHFDLLFLGLTAPLPILDTRINRRVLDRATPRFTREVNYLLKKYPKFQTLPAATATGYSEWLKYLSHHLTQAEAIELWQLHERQYARRQLTWFKKDAKVQWFDITKTSFPTSVVQRVESWYSGKYAQTARNSIRHFG